MCLDHIRANGSFPANITGKKVHGSLLCNSPAQSFFTLAWYTNSACTSFVKHQDNRGAAEEMHRHLWPGYDIPKVLVPKTARAARDAEQKLWLSNNAMRTSFMMSFVIWAATHPNRKLPDRKQGLDVFRWLCLKLAQTAPAVKLHVHKHGANSAIEVPLESSLLLEGSSIWPTERHLRESVEREWNFMRTSNAWSSLIQSAFNKPCLVDLVAYAFARQKQGYLCHSCVLSMITQIADAIDQNLMAMATPLDRARNRSFRTGRLLRAHQREQLCLTAMEMWRKEDNEDCHALALSCRHGLS